MNPNGYEQFLTKNNLTDETLLRLMELLPSPVGNPLVDAAFEIAPSAINGNGMFARRPIAKGETFPVAEGLRRFNLARYVNHSDAPNGVAEFYKGGTIEMVVISEIPKGGEVTMDYSDNLKKTIAAIT